MRDGVIALGLGGAEIGNPAQKHQAAFDIAYAAGLPSLPHAGETDGPLSIWGALASLHPRRILHGVRCVEDNTLMGYLRDKQIPLDVCPVSNLRLNVFPSIQQHPLPYLLDSGLVVTISSDDPPMFNTSLTNEYLTIAKAFRFPPETIQQLVMNGVQHSLLLPDAKASLTQHFEHEFATLRGQLDG
jgi:adenosine deaminase